MTQATSRIERQITNLIRSALDPELIAEPQAHTRTGADLESPYAKVAVFVDGCYWHGCLEHAKDTSLAARRRARDADKNENLERFGWLVLRVWEHEEHLAPFIARVVESIGGRAAQRRAEVLAHIQTHAPGAWCASCSDWPHVPVEDPDGWCDRCGMPSSDHEYDAVERRLFGQ